MPVEFEIEEIFAVTGRGTFVAARLLTPELSFTVPAAATIGGVAIECWVDQPRKIGANGEPRLDSYVFKLKCADDRAALTSGQRVLLE